MYRMLAYLDHATWSHFDLYALLWYKKPHWKYKVFPPIAKTLSYIFSHSFWTWHFQRKYEHFLKTRKIDLKHIKRRKKGSIREASGPRNWPKLSRVYMLKNLFRNPKLYTECKNILGNFPHKMATRKNFKEVAGNF